MGPPPTNGRIICVVQGVLADACLLRHWKAESQFQGTNFVALCVDCDAACRRTLTTAWKFTDAALWSMSSMPSAPANGQVVQSGDVQFEVFCHSQTSTSSLPETL